MISPFARIALSAASFIGLVRAIARNPSQPPVGLWVQSPLRGIIDERIEDACNAIAAAVIAPRRPFLARLREAGSDWAQLALPFGMTETSAALRAGEAAGIPLAVVSRHVRTRGPESFVWPEEDTLRRWARAPPVGLAKTRLTDDPTRVVLVADEARECG